MSIQKDIKVSPQRASSLELRGVEGAVSAFEASVAYTVGSALGL